MFTLEWLFSFFCLFWNETDFNDVVMFYLRPEDF